MRAPLTLLLSTLTLLGCRDAPAPTPPAVDVEVVGARAWADGGRTPVFDVDALPVLRLTGATAGLEVRAPESLRFESVQRGEATIVRVREVGSGPLSVVVSGHEVHRVEARWEPSPDVLLADAVRLRKTGAPAKALAALDAIAEPWAKFWVPVERARALSRLGRAEEARAAWLAGAEAATKAGVPSEASRRLRAAAFQLVWARRFDEAERLLDRARAIDRQHGFALGEARGDYYRGMLAQERGRLRAALRHLSAARETAWLNGADADAAYAVLELAHLMPLMGRIDESMSMLDEAEVLFREVPAARRHRAHFETTRGWIELRALLLGHPRVDLERVRRRFTKAAETLAETGASPARRANLWVNRAWVEHLTGDLGAMRAALAEARRLDPEATGFSGLAARLLAAELALADGQADAAARFAGVAEATRASHAALTWQARFGEGRALRRAGDAAGAARAFDAGLAAVDEQAREVVLGAPRAVFFAHHQPLVDVAIELALESGDVAGAFARADAALARTLRALDAQVRVERLSPEARARWEEAVGGWLDARAAFEAAREERDLLPQAKLAGWEAERRASAQALSTKLDGLYASLDAWAPAAAPVGARVVEIQAALGPHDALRLRVRRASSAMRGGSDFGGPGAATAREVDAAKPGAATGGSDGGTGAATAERPAGATVAARRRAAKRGAATGGSDGGTGAATAERPAGAVAREGDVAKPGAATGGSDGGTVAATAERPAGATVAARRGVAKPGAAGRSDGGTAAAPGVATAERPAGGTETPVHGAASPEGASPADAFTFCVTPTAVRLGTECVPEAGGHLYLVGHFEPTDLPDSVSASLLPSAGFLPRAPAATEAAPLVVGDPEGNLPHARAEAEAVARALSDARLVRGAEASRSSLLSVLDGARLFHFAGHGELAPDTPWGAHLRLAEGERLSLADLLVARPATGVVFLSGCETGRRLALSRDEHVGLPAAFLLAGGRAVVATTRPVADEATRRFVERFYAAGGATSPGVALRVARESVADDAFYLVGRP